MLPTLGASRLETAYYNPSSRVLPALATGQAPVSPECLLEPRDLEDLVFIHGHVHSLYSATQHQFYCMPGTGLVPRGEHDRCSLTLEKLAV